VRAEIAHSFNLAQIQNRALLIGYLPIGFPNPKTFASLLKAAAGLDLLELGFPCSDPSMDGPVIRTAMEVALKGGIDTEAAFAIISGLKGQVRPPMVAMAYWLTVEHYGVDRFLEACIQARFSGVLFPDVPAGLLSATCRAVQQRDLAWAGFLQEPSSVEAYRSAPECSPAFFYLRSSGVTGEAVDIERAAAGLAELRQRLNGSATPVALGFGIQTPEDVAALSARGADAVVVGTVLVKAASQGTAAFRRTVAALAAATRRE
jgi:tryptophan synthase alpha chain